MNPHALEKLATDYLIFLPIAVGFRLLSKKMARNRKVPEGLEMFYAKGAIGDSGPYVICLLAPLLPFFSSTALWVLGPIVVPLVHIGIGKLIKKDLLP